MYWVYALKSVERNYIQRIGRHNRFQNKKTKSYAPFNLVYKASFTERVQAREYEKYLKSGCGKEFIKSLIK